MAHGPSSSRSQDDCRLPQGQRRAIRQVCGRFVALCRTIGLLTEASVAIDGSKFKAVNNRDKNFTRAKMERRMAQIEDSVARYLHQLDTADRLGQLHLYLDDRFPKAFGQPLIGGISTPAKP